MDSISNADFYPDYSYGFWDVRRNNNTYDLHFGKIQFKTSMNQTSSLALKISPNPSNYPCFSFQSAYMGALQVTISDEQGQIVHQYVVQKTEDEWSDTYYGDQLLDGIYFITVQGGTDIWTGKWIKQG